MATRERLFDRGTEHSRQLTARVGHELRDARRGLGLSLAEVGRAVRLSEGQISRIERGLVERVTVEDLARLHVVLGLDLSVRSYPGGRPIRDVAHVQLLSELRARLHRTLRWSVEVPLPIPGDLRAWDAMIRGSTFRFGVEAETAPRDAQALTRRVLTKARDGEVDGVILLVRATLQSRGFMAETRDWLAGSFPVDGKRALDLLAAGASPGGNALIVLPPSRGPRPGPKRAR